jgi:hypothetical protein
MGRHGKAAPRRRGLVLAAAVPVAAVTVPLFHTATASAATGTVWDKLAFCESTNDWAINTGNGYYGGVQFSLSTWKEFGGLKYAARADLATKAQQIEIAKKVQAVQGWNAWPACNRKLGLAELAAQDAARGIASTLDAKVSTPAPSSSPSPSPSSSSERASRSTTRAPMVKAPTVTVKKPSTPVLYKVQGGDTLSSIAGDHDVAGGWQALFAMNRSVVDNPNLIYPGDLLRTN